MALLVRYAQGLSNFAPGVMELHGKVSRQGDLERSTNTHTSLVAARVPNDHREVAATTQEHACNSSRVGGVVATVLCFLCLIAQSPHGNSVLAGA